MKIQQTMDTPSPAAREPHHGMYPPKDENDDVEPKLLVDILVRSLITEMEKSDLRDKMKQQVKKTLQRRDYVDTTTSSRATYIAPSGNKKQTATMRSLELMLVASLGKDVEESAMVPTDDSDTADATVHDAPSPARRRRSVAFNQVRVRQYQRILSDNPSVRNGGPGVGIGWCYVDMGSQSIGDYESGRAHRRRRHASELLLNSRQRRNLLKEFGYKDKQIARTVRSTTRTKAQRRQTVANLKVQGVEEIVESISQQFKKAFLPV